MTLSLPKNNTVWILLGAACALVISFIFSSIGFSSLSFIFGGLAFLVVSILVVRRPFLGLALVVFLLPFERIGALQLGTVTVRSSQIISLVMIVAWIWEQFLSRRFQFKRNPLFLPLVAFLVVSVVSVTRAVNVDRGFQVILFTAFVFVVSLVTTQLIRTKRQAETLVNILLFIATIVSLFGIFQFVGDLVGLPASWTGLDIIYQKQVFGFPRIQATSLEPLYFADFLMLPLGLVIAKMFAEKDKYTTWLWVSLTTLFLINFVLTVSRGAYFGGVAMLIIIVLYNFRRVFSRRNLTIYLSILGVAFIAVVALIGLSSNAQKTLLNFQSHVLNITSGASFAERQDTITDALNSWKAHPFLGIGPGNFGPSIATNPLVTPEKGWLIVNNETIEILTEVGVVGLLVFVWAMGAMLLTLFRASRRCVDPTLRTLLVATFGAIIGILVQYQTFSTLYIMNIWVYFGFGMALSNLVLTEKVTEQSLSTPTK
jgi:O-antigen ligase